MNLKEACEQYLQYTGLGYEATGTGEHGQLQWMHQGPHGGFWLCLQPLPSLDMLLVGAVYPDFVPRNRLDQIMELGHRLNTLPLPGVFVVDVEWGQFRFEQRMDVGREGVLDTDKVAESLTFATGVLDSLMENFRAVCDGRLSAKECVEEDSEALMAALDDRLSIRDALAGDQVQNIGMGGPEVPEDDLARASGWCSPEQLLSGHADTLTPIPPEVGSLDSLIGLRRENQDYGVAFTCDQSSHSPVVLAVADGLGGHPGGRAASFLACSGVVSAAARSAGLSPQNLLAVLRDGAESTLAGFAWRQPPETCLTTLILVVATSERYYLCWIGDGGAAIRRRDGKWLTAMEPHRGSSGMLNHVGAFLGAQRRGFWSISEFPRMAGDLLVVGSDGLMERTFHLEAFFRKPRQQVADGACLQDAMSRYLEDCVTRHPHVFDDNLTLVCLLTPDAGES